MELEANADIKGKLAIGNGSRRKPMDTMYVDENDGS
jgi:hypothetical protein